MTQAPLARLLAASLLAILAGCAVPPPDAYVNGASATAAAGVPLGNNAANEPCTQQSQGAGGADVYCGTWQQPSARIRSAGVIDAGSLTSLATSSPWRQTIDERFACGDPKTTTILDGLPAVVLSCTRRQGGWPHAAMVVAVAGGNGWYADGVLPALPAMERSIGILSGRLSPDKATTAQSSGADALLAGRLAAQAFSSGDVGQYDALITAGGRANQSESFAAAETAFRAALQLQEKALGAGNPNTATTLARLALQVSNQGRFAEADGLFDRAAALAVKSEDPLAVPRVAHYRALNLMNQGKPQEALPLLQTAEAGYAARLSPDILNAKPKPKRIAASASLADALPDRDLVADPQVRGAVLGVVEVRRYKAIALRSLGRLDEADAQIVSARALAQANNLTEPVVTARLIRTAGADSNARHEPIVAALQFNQAANYFATALPRSRPFAETKLLEAAAVSSSGDGFADALVACEEGVSLLREQSLGVSPNVLAPCLDTYAAAADAAEPAKRQPLLVAMFEASQLAQGGVTSNQIAQATARLAEGARDPKVAAAIRARQDAVGKLADLDRERDELLQSRATSQSGIVAAPTGTAPPELEKRIADARAAVAEADAALQAASPNYGQLIQQVAKAPDIFHLLRPGEAFVSTALTDKGGWTFVLRDGEVTAARITEPAATIEQLVKRIRAGEEEKSDGAQPPFAFDTEAAERLYTAVLGGAAPALQEAKAIVVAPSGPLLSVPFGMLLTGPADPKDLRHAPWLIRQATISHVPAAANFVSLRKVAGTSHAGQPWFGFGDFRPTPLPLAQKSFPPATCGDSADAFANRLPPLPGTLRELDLARQSLGAPAQNVLLGPAFTSAEVRKMPLKDYRILHFATHGLLPGDLTCLTESAIVTSPSPGAKDASGSLLTVSQVVELDLDADAVILSACNSGGGSGTPTGNQAGESLSGLARAFFYAGARSLLVTHWSVDDTATAYLVAYSLKVAGVTDGGIAASVRSAQLSMINGTGGLPEAWAHPYFWAPLALIGDGGGAKLNTASAAPAGISQAARIGL